MPGCSWFLGRSEHTCGPRAQQEDCSEIELNPQPFNTSAYRGVGSSTELPPTPTCVGDFSFNDLNLVQVILEEYCGILEEH